MKKLLHEFTFENYYSKEEIGYRLPNDISLDDFWKKTVALRSRKADHLSFVDQNNRPFWYFLIPSLQKSMHNIDSRGKDSLYSRVRQEIESELIKDSLIEEAFYSSVIEGALTTIKRLKEMVDKKRSPKDDSDQMVLNNYYAMQFILQEKHKDISLDVILELHKIITHKTLFGDDAVYSGRFRDDIVCVKDNKDRVIYTPPSGDKILPAMESLIRWVNNKEDSSFIHPIIKASILHFYMVYIRPFFDGNARTARALFYFYLIKNNYEFFKYFSISVIVEKTKGQYYRAIKNVEDYEADLTYFLIYMARTVGEAITVVIDRIVRQYHKMSVFGKLQERGILLNRRQEKFLKRFLVREREYITIKSYQNLHKVVYETARRDLEDLYVKQILKKTKQKRTFVYTPNYTF